MYEINEREYKELQRIVNCQMRKYMGLYKYDRDEFISRGNLAIGKACVTFDPSKGVKFNTYVTTIIMNEFAMHHRANKNKIGRMASLDYEIENKKGDNFSMLETVPSDLTNYDGIIAKADVDRARKVLNEKESQVIDLLLQGYKQIEIADILGISQGAISKYIKRIYDKMKRELGVI